MWPSLGDAVTASFATEYDEQADDESEASFLCSECPKTFPPKRNLVRHTKSVHGKN